MRVEVEIKNFQGIAHEKIVIDGFSTITGRSNIGKSSIVRAIRSALTGAPADNLVRHSLDCPKAVKGAKTCKCYCRVHIKSEGFDLLWEKGDSVNQYRYNGTDYTVPGRGAPEFLEAKYLPAKLGGESLLLQVTNQFEPLFLLDRTGTVSAELLSDVVKLDQVNAALKLSEKERKSASSTRKVREKDLASVDGRIQATTKIQEAVDLSARATSLVSKVEAGEAREESLQAFSAKVDSLVRSLNKVSKVEAIEVDPNLLGPVSEAGQKLLTGEGKLVKLRVLVPQVKSLSSLPTDPPPPVTGLVDSSSRLLDGSKRLSKLQAMMGLNLDSKLSEMDQVLIPDLGGVVSRWSKLSSLLGWNRRLLQIPTIDKEVPDVLDLPTISVATALRIESWGTQLESIVKEINSQTQDLKATDLERKKIQDEIDALGVCPTCKQPWAMAHSTDTDTTHA